METRRLVNCRSLFRDLVLFFIVTLAILTPGSSAKLYGQTLNKGVTPVRPDNETVASPDKSIPADHYDPDDTKTYADVVVEDRDVVVRDRKFTVHFYRPRVAGAAIPAIYACGDGGWRGLAPRTAEQLAHVGLAVAGIDSKVYLRQFSSLKKPLTIETLASDFSDIANALRAYASVDQGTPIFIYGWSLGAGFAIAVGSDAKSRANWAGIVSIGLPKQNQLISGVGGNYANLHTEGNATVGFRSADLMAAISPLPLVMIQSTSDTASPPKVGGTLFAVAGDPKQYVLINASNHRFSGARDDFYSALSKAVAWMREAAKDGRTRQAALMKSKGGQ